jgi:hypothetical protein
MAERPFRKPKIRLHLPAQEDRCGSGALCAEAQADGVPCSELGRECETCEKATRGSFRRGLNARPGGVAQPAKTPARVVPNAKRDSSGSRKR